MGCSTLFYLNAASLTAPLQCVWVRALWWSALLAAFISVPLVCYEMLFRYSMRHSGAMEDILCTVDCVGNLGDVLFCVGYVDEAGFVPISVL